jgi:small subunit ribosomal protein S7
MPRKKLHGAREQLKPDARFNSLLVSKFINCLMWDGKKSVASKVFYDALDIIAKRIKDVPPLEVFETAINNVKPNIEVRSKRVGGSNYQVPMQVSRKRQQSLAIRWILQAVRGRSGKPTSHFLAQEIARRLQA